MTARRLSGRLYFGVCRSSYYAKVWHVGVGGVVLICGANRSRTLSFLQKNLGFTSYVDENLALFSGYFFNHFSTKRGL